MSNADNIHIKIYRYEVLYPNIQTKLIFVKITKYYLNNKMHRKRCTSKNKMHLKRFQPGCNIYGDPNEKG